MAEHEDSVHSRAAEVPPATPQAASSGGAHAAPPLPLPPPDRATDADVEAARVDARARSEVARQKLTDVQQAFRETNAEDLQATARAKYLERPEVFVGAVFVGGLLLAQLLKALGDE